MTLEILGPAPFNLILFCQVLVSTEVAAEQQLSQEITEWGHFLGVMGTSAVEFPLTTGMLLGSRAEQNVSGVLTAEMCDGTFFFNILVVVSSPPLPSLTLNLRISSDPSRAAVWFLANLFSPPGL